MSTTASVKIVRKSQSRIAFVCLIVGLILNRGRWGFRDAANIHCLDGVRGKLERRKVAKLESLLMLNTESHPHRVFACFEPTPIII